MREATRSGKLTDAGAVEAAAQILEGLAHAHGKGIVHRDVKPANVLLEDGPEISIRLLDFGLARFAAGGDADRRRRRARDARVHLAGAAAWRGGVSGERRVVGRGDALGSARRPPPVLGAVAARDLEEDRGRRSAAGEGPAGPAEAARRRDRTRAPPRSHPAALRSRAREDAAARAKKARLPRRRPRRSPLPPSAAGSRRPRRARGALRRMGGLRAVLLSDGLAGRSRAPGRDPHLLQRARRARLRARRAGLSAGQHRPGARPSVRRAAAVWFLLHVREPRAAFAFILGPLLAPLSLLGFLPLALQPVRSAWRRALQAGTAVLTAALVAGLTGRSRFRSRPGGSTRSDWRRSAAR